MPGFARVAGEYQGRITYVGVDIGPYVGLGNHEDGRRQLARTGTQYPAAYATDTSGMELFGVRHTPATVVMDRTGKVLKKVDGAFSEDSLRQLSAQLAGS